MLPGDLDHFVELGARARQQLLEPLEKLAPSRRTGFSTMEVFQVSTGFAAMR